MTGAAPYAHGSVYLCETFLTLSTLGQQVAPIGEGGGQALWQLVLGGYRYSLVNQVPGSFLVRQALQQQDFSAGLKYPGEGEGMVDGSG
jgi:hypothetical protein